MRSIAGMSGDRLPLSEPVELFLVDVDNTLTQGGGLPFNLNLMLEVQAMSARARKDRAVPPIALITGRPQPYLEAMQQAVASPVPGVFEFGYGVYDLLRERAATHPAWTPAMAAERERLVERCEQEFAASRRGRLRHGNTTSVTVIPSAPDSIESRPSCIVKIAPATRASPTEAAVRAMFCSSTLPRRNGRRKAAMASTAAGKVADTV